MDHHQSQPQVEEEEEQDFVSTLHSAPSFAIYTSHGDDGGADENYTEEVLKRRGSFEFTFGKNERVDVPIGIQNLSIQEEEDEEDVVDLEPPSPPMYLAAGLGVDAAMVGYGYDSFVASDEHVFNPGLQGSGDLEGYYKRMVDEYPCHPFILKKYAQILQSKGELGEAEEYFYRATLADPNDGESLMEYAKLLWEQHHEKDKAMVYFERAAQASPADSHVLAAYTSFLWETEGDDNEVGKHEAQDDKEKHESEPVKPNNEESDPPGQEIDVSNLNAANWSDESKFADYLKKMINENPSNPLLLKKYAQFLSQTKDLEAAEGYYSRAVLADPSDGETMSEYASLVWELHHDQEKASNLFEQAVQATPKDSNVLAAYTYFLWGTEDVES